MCFIQLNWYEVKWKEKERERERVTENTADYNNVPWDFFSIGDTTMPQCRLYDVFIKNMKNETKQWNAAATEAVERQ